MAALPLIVFDVNETLNPDTLRYLSMTSKIFERY